LAELTTWLLSEGVICITAPECVLAACDSWFRSHRSALAFPGRLPCAGILKHQPAAVIIPESPGAPSLEALWQHITSRDETTVVVLPISSHEPGYPHRRLEEMWTRPKLTLRIWEDLYRE